MLSKKGELTNQEILEIVLALIVVFGLASLFSKLVSPIDVNKEYAEGVYAKLEQAASELEESGSAKFSILDVPVDYGDSVFLVLFSGKDYVTLSEYPVEIKNSGFMTYVKKSTGPVLSEGRGVYRSLIRNELVSAGVADDIADNVAAESSSDIAENIAEESLKNVDNFMFDLDMDYIVEEFAKETGVGSDDIVKKLSEVSFDGLSPADKMVALKKALSEVAEISVQSVDDVFFEIEMPQIVKNFVKTSGLVGADDIVKTSDNIVKELLEEGIGKGLDYNGKINALKDALGKRVSAGSKIGKYNSIDSFMNSARGISKGNTMKTLSKEAGDNIQFQKFIWEVLPDENVEKAIKEMTDETFAKGMKSGDKILKLKNIVRKYADVSDDAFGKIKTGLSGEESLKLALGESSKVSDDAMKMVVDNIVAVRSLPADDVVDDIIKGAVKKSFDGKGVADDVVESATTRVVKTAEKKVTRLTFRVAGGLVTAAFVVWEAYEYYNVAQDAQARVLTMLNQEEVIVNDWVATKLLVSGGGNNALCVCYVDDNYKKNYCLGCVGFDKPVVTDPEGENYWTFCEEIILSDKGNFILLSSSVKDDCKPSIAFTNVECDESASVLKEKLSDPNDKLFGAAASVVAGGSYGLLMGSIGGAVGGGIGLLFGGAGVVPSAILGAKWGVAIGVAVGSYSGYEGVDFSCDKQGHIYMGETTE